MEHVLNIVILLQALYQFENVFRLLFRYLYCVQREPLQFR
jgi:hypothetical protein